MQMDANGQPVATPVMPNQVPPTPGEAQQQQQGQAPGAVGDGTGKDTTDPLAKKGAASRFINDTMEPKR